MDDAGADIAQAARRLRQALDAYLADKDFGYFSDERHVMTVIAKLAERENAYGRPYCPCRLVTGDAQVDGRIVCPCAYHVREIEEQGHCCCRLFAAR